MSLVLRGHDDAGAIFSDEPVPIYRYALWRAWRPGNRGRALFVMLNPSTADEVTDDATIRRCRGYAKAWGYDGLTVCNLYAYRATDPRRLTHVADPIGPENEAVLESHARSAGLVVCAWGGAGSARGTLVAKRLLDWAHGPLYALAWTKHGAPRHPLYLGSHIRPLPWLP